MSEPAQEAAVKRFLIVVVVLAAAAAVYLTLKDDEAGPPRDVFVRIDAEPTVCWTALVDTGDPEAEPRSEADCGARQIPFTAAAGSVVVSKVGDPGEVSVSVVVDGAERQRRSTADPRGTVVLEL